MRKILLAILLLPFAVLADPAEVTWTPPTERESCEEVDEFGICDVYTPLLPSEIGGYRIYNLTTNDPIPDAGPSDTSAIVDLAKGIVHRLVVTTFDTDGRESVYSEEVSVFKDHASPKQPTSPTVNFLP